MNDLSGLSKNTTWGIDCFNATKVKSIPSPIMNTYTTDTGPLPDMVVEGGVVWKPESGKKRRILDAVTVNALGGWSKVNTISSYNFSLPEGMIFLVNGYTVRFSDSAIVYRYDNNSLHQVPSLAEYNAWGLYKSPTTTIPAEYNVTALPITEPVSQLAYEQSSDQYYIIDKGFKMLVGTSSVNQWPTAKQVKLDATLQLMPERTLGIVYYAPNDAIYTVSNGKKIVVATMNDVFGLGIDLRNVRELSSDLDDNLGLVYGGMHLSNGRLYKIYGQPHQIYMTAGYASKYINSTNYPGLPYDKIITIDQITADRYPVSGTYQP
jgi:hypothetical protein